LTDSQHGVVASRRSQPTRRASSDFLQAWARPEIHRTAQGLTIAAAALLFLSAAGTVEFAYTIRISYGLLALACIIGAPWVVRGWKSSPTYPRWAGVALLLTYSVSALFGRNAVLSGQARAGEYRFALYLLDLALGIALVGLVAGLWPHARGIRPLLMALVIGAFLAALYALYQWPAQHLHWPFADLNNTRDSNGVTTGASQGNGIFGWERARGTFLEPHFLAAYLTTVLPISTVFLADRVTWRRVFGAAASLTIALALFVAMSAAAFVILCAGGFAGLTVAAVGQGKVRLAGLAGALVLSVLILGLSIVGGATRIVPAVGRSEGDLRSTTAFRTQTWHRAIEIWTHRPTLGYGPGQSSVQLALTEGSQSGRSSSPPTVLRSAQGLWAASLVDAGVIGFAMWVLFLGLLLAAGIRACLVAPRFARVALIVAAFIGVGGAEVAGDRLELTVWMMLGLVLAMASGAPSKSDNPRSRHETQRGTDESP
jgi:hypothetical protein